MTRLIVGCGYLGSRVAQRWQQAGFVVHCLTRSTDRAATFRAGGLLPVLGDVTQPHTLRLPPARTVLYAVGHDRASGLSVREVYVNGLRNVLAALSPECERIIYISSTGVYGSADGDWVREESPCHPVSESGKACQEAEQVLREHPLGKRSIILRLAGIYGPGRLPWRDRIQAGLPIEAASTGTLNLIHVDDAARVVLAAEERAALPCLYLVSDGQPIVRGEYYAEVARLLGAPPPIFTPPPPDSARSGRAAADKKIDSRRLFADLGITLLYPNYQTGLKALVGDMKEPKIQ